MTRGVGAGAAIFDAAGRVLLVKHTYGPLNWEVPGGGSEAGESPAETVVREVREETGLDVVPQHVTGYYYEPAVDLVHFMFRCDVENGRETRPDGMEISECAWCDLDDLPRPINDFTVRRVRDAVDVVFPVPRLVGPRRWLE